MRPTATVAALLAALLAAPGLATAAEPSPVAGNMSLVSEYRFRGIDQTFGKPALQGGFDYAHSSGAYLGNWNSNVNPGAGFNGANLDIVAPGGGEDARIPDDPGCRPVRTAQTSSSTTFSRRRSGSAP